MQGWIKLHRKILNHWVSDEPECFAVWMRMLIEANHDSKKRMFNGELIEIKRGQLIFGYPKFSAKSGVSIAKLRRYLTTFKKEGLIDRQISNKYSLITITSYDDYQDSTGKEQAENSRSTGAPQHLKNVKNVKNNNTIVSSKNETAKNDKYCDEFDWIWERKPPRQGTNSKHDAYKACKARLKAGETWHDMAQGLIRYTKFIVGTGKMNTEHVMMMRTFFGPSCHFKQDWSFTDATNTKHNANASAAEQVKAAWEAKQQSGSSKTLGAGGEPVRTEMDKRLGDDAERNPDAVTIEHNT